MVGGPVALSLYDQHIARARTALDHGRWNDVREAATEAQKLNGADPETWFMVGMAAYHQNAYAQAEKLFAHAAQLDPRNPKPLALRGASLSLCNRAGEAEMVTDAAAALRPVEAEVLDTLGVTYSKVGAYAKAVEMFRRAIAINPRNTAILLNLAYGEQFLGNLDAAEATFRQAIAVDPNTMQAYFAIVEMRNQTPESNFIEKLLELYQTSWESTELRLWTAHALAKTYEDLGQLEEVMTWLERGKEGRRTTVGFSIDAERDTFAAAAETFQKDDVVRGGFSSEEPIFVVGLPRTGTTLVDRILSSHPDVTSAEEMPNFPVLVKNETRSKTPKLVAADAFRIARQLDFTRLGADYIKSTRPRTGRTARFVDKLPHNFLYAGLIHRALPEARIICLRRDGMDTVLNNYRQMFAPGSYYHDYTTRLEDVAHYFVAFDRLMAHWREVLPADRFIEVNYEDLVADQEAQSRRMVEFCDLPWDDRCLAFHENVAGVSTASSAQVRSPIYATSVGRWKRYGDALKPAADILRDAGLLNE
jgi:tetratricopeptide (TPR) repeat protein